MVYKKRVGDPLYGAPCLSRVERFDQRQRLFSGLVMNACLHLSQVLLMCSDYDKRVSDPLRSTARLSRVWKDLINSRKLFSGLSMNVCLQLSQVLLMRSDYGKRVSDPLCSSARLSRVWKATDNGFFLFQGRQSTDDSPNTTLPDLQDLQEAGQRPAT
jgi:uncharacterized protein YeeX (DUF496 family)